MNDEKDEIEIAEGGWYTAIVKGIFVSGTYKLHVKYAGGKYYTLGGNDVTRRVVRITGTWEN